MKEENTDKLVISLERELFIKVNRLLLSSPIKSSFNLNPSLRLRYKSGTPSHPSSYVSEL